MLDNRQAFKAAFLHRCLEHGMTLEETHILVKDACATLQGGTKEANVWPWIRANVPGVSPAADVLAEAMKGVVQQVPSAALATYVGVPAAVGGLAGYGLAQAEGLNDEDADEIKTQEKIEAYRRATDRAAIQKQLRSAQQLRRPSRPAL